MRMKYQIAFVSTRDQRIRSNDVDEGMGQTVMEGMKDASQIFRCWQAIYMIGDAESRMVLCSTFMHRLRR